MTSIAAPYVKAVPGYTVPPKIVVQFRMLRDGEVTPGSKVVRVYRDWDVVQKLDLSFEAELGEFSRALTLDLATLLDQGSWLVAGLDLAPPKRTRAAYLSFSESGVYTFNITSGEGGGQQGDPGQVSGLVRVERLPANREIVLVERPADGEWRLAGYGPTPGGSGDIDVRVVGGDVYAIGVDDYGVAFVPDLVVQVGQRIRPTQYAGWVYEITDAGQLPAVEPAWWAAQGENPSQPLGSARAVARRYFQPIAHGPVPVEVI
ncbi:hypothetical protein [Stutzerimonas nitrititolerans]|uniref:hypothetical protein n=1 Tax=Stutzerimonas nitrititolerans TaxID=2482751 RepID=UPI0014833217|nr:hypothetical protein [Stutzerimonas nitrititolerans]NNT92293.1 hypothetical protein [Stutzerimonas nitrititolerans]